MSIRKRLERLKAGRSPPAETTRGYWEVMLYCKAVENHRREQTGEPPMPLTPEEKRLEHEGDNDPELHAYLEEINEQWKERIRREATREEPRLSL